MSLDRCRGITSSVLMRTFQEQSCVDYVTRDKSLPKKLSFDDYSALTDRNTY